MKKLFMFAVMAATCLAAGAQSALDLKITPLIDKGDFAKAEEILNGELAKVNEKWDKKKQKDPAALPDTKKLAEVYNKLGMVYGMQFNTELLNAAQSLPLDTLKYINMLDKTIDSYTKSHLNDVTPDDKGKVKSRFEASNKKMLLGMLDYYYYSGIFMHQNQDMKASCREFKKFIDFRKNPAFSAEQQDSIYQAKKDLYDQAALNVALLYYQDKDWDNLLACVDDAMGDPKNKRDAYIMKMNAYLEKQDTAAWVHCLEDAIVNVEDNSNFMEQLVGYYTGKNDAAAANAYADKLLSANPNDKNALYMKGCTKLNLESKYAEASEYFKKAVEIDPNYAEANLNLAYCYMNDIREQSMSGKYKYAFRSSYTAKEKDAYMKELNEIRSYYEKARPYVEHVRELKPDEIKMWAPALSIIYSNLGMKTEAKEVDDLISASYKK